MSGRRPPWAQAIRAAREGRLWSIKRLAQGLIEEAKASTGGAPTLVSLSRTIRRWEAGENYPDEINRWLLTRVLETTEHALFGGSATPTTRPIPEAPSLGTGRVIQALQSIDVAVRPVDAIWAPAARSGDWTTWFGRRLAQLLTVLDGWRDSAYLDELQTLLHREILMFDAVQPVGGNEYRVSRRQVLATLAALPVALCPSLQEGNLYGVVVEKFVRACAASITACWHLLKGRDLAVVEETLSSYLLLLATVAHRPSRSQVSGARLVSQGYRLLGIIALHHSHTPLREHYFHQALKYAEIAGDPKMRASALISLASTPLLYGDDPTRAAVLYERALSDNGQIHPLQYTRVHAELAIAYGQLGQERQALHFLSLAQDQYPQHPENDPSFLYAEFTPSSFILDQGVAYLALARHFPHARYELMAWDTFEQVKPSVGSAAVPVRIRAEIINQQALTAVALRDLDAFEGLLKQGIEGAEALKSAQRRREAQEAWRQALEVWSAEPRVRALRELVSSASGGSLTDGE